MLRSYSLCDNKIPKKKERVDSLFLTLWSLRHTPMGYGGRTAKYRFHLIGVKRDKKTHSFLTEIEESLNITR